MSPGLSVMDGARTAFRTVTESPHTFGPMHTKVQESIKTLLAVSEMTSQYLKEGRMDGSVEQELAQLSRECRNHLVELENMGQEFDAMDTQAFRQNDISNLTDVLDAKARTFEDINSKVNTSLLQFEKALKRYIAQVKNGERASSIWTTISSTAASSALNHDEWQQIQIELESVGITVAQFNSNRAKILSILRCAFQEDLEEDSPIRIKKARKLNRLLSSFSSKSKDLLAAAKDENIQEARTLLIKGAYINTQDSNGFTPLYLAVRNQNFGLAGLFLSYQADINKRPKPGQISQSPLICAVRSGRVDLINLLLEHGAEINESGPDRRTPLHLAVKDQSLTVVNTLLERGANVSAKYVDSLYSRSGTALGIAIEDQSMDIIETLVRHGSDVNQNVSGHMRPLSLALLRAGRNIVEFLLKEGAQIDYSALCIAVAMETPEYLRLLFSYQPKVNSSSLVAMTSRVGSEDALCLLINKGADVNAAGEVELPFDPYLNEKLKQIGDIRAGRITPLWLAAAYGRHKSLNLLLAKGADIKTRAYTKMCNNHWFERCLFAGKGVEKCTALQIAVSHGHWKCARLLIHWGSDLNAWVYCTRRDPTKLLHLAVGAPVRPMEKVRLLAQIGADLNTKNHSGQTPLQCLLHDAMTHGGETLSLARSLVAKGARVDVRDDAGRTPLHNAVGAGDFRRRGKLIEMLLENGADPNAKEKEGRTPLHYAHSATDFGRLVRAGCKGSIADNRGRRAQVPSSLSLMWYLNSPGREATNNCK